MELGAKSVTVIAIAAAGIAIGAYVMGANQGKPQVEESHKEVVAETAPDPVLPAAHPAVSQQDSEAQSGAAGQDQADPNAKFTHFNVGNSNVKSLYIKGDEVWVGTSTGVVRYNTKNDQYHHYDNRNGLISNGVFWVGEIGGNIAVGTYGGGLSILNLEKETWKNYNIADGLGDAFVYGALEAQNGDVWIATWSGANLIKGGKLDDRSAWTTFTVESTSGGLPNDWVYGLAQGKDGEMWLATEGGLARYKNGNWQNWNHKNGLGASHEVVKNDPQFGNDPAAVSSHHAKQKKEMGLGMVNVAFNPNYIISMQVANDGTVWCGTWGGGLAHFDGATWKNYTMADGMPGNHVFMLNYDKDGVLWIGTNSGLGRYDGKNFTKYTTADGLFADSVFSMATAADKTRWVGSFGGVSRMRGL